MGSLSLQRLCILGALELVLVLSLIRGSFAQENSTCNLILAPLVTCVPYLQAGNTSAPDATCCTPLRSALGSADPTCFCQLGSGAVSQLFNITINETRIAEVALSCNQTVPASVSACLNQTAAPLGAPTAGPTTSPSPTISPLGAPSTSPTGPATSPSTSTSSPSPLTENGNSSGSDLSPSHSLLLVGSIIVALFLHLGGTTTST